MQSFLLSLHVLISLALIGLVLLQHGKGADAGAAFGAGGSSGTLFGSRGTTPFLVKLTSVIAVSFFISSLALTYTSSHQHSAPLIQAPSEGQEQDKAISIPFVDALKELKDEVSQ